jgi:type I restriction enzyme R subunit
VGVTESEKTLVQPLERKRGVAFEKLLENVASGQSDPDTVSSLAHRLAILDRKLGPEDKHKVEETAGKSLSALAGELVDALDEDRMDAAQDPVAEGRRLREEALRPFDKPGLRSLLIELKKASEIIVGVRS